MECKKVPYIFSELNDFRLTPVELRQVIAELLDRKRRSNFMSPKSAREIEEDICLMLSWYAEGKGPIFDAELQKIERSRGFLISLVDAIHNKIGIRPYLSHEHIDLIRNDIASPREIRAAEFEQITTRTSLLVVVADNLSWEGGILTGWCEDRGIPIWILRTKKASRLLLGVTTVQQDIRYENYDELCSRLDMLLELSLA